MAWRKPAPSVFPAPLAGFREQEWPPVPGECLEVYSCRGEGYERPCVPRQGEACGQLHLEHLSEHRPDLLPRARAKDARIRWRQARMNWLGEDHPLWIYELVGWLEDDGRM